MVPDPVISLGNGSDEDFSHGKTFNVADVHTYFVDGASNLIPDHSTGSGNSHATQVPRFPSCPGPAALDAASAMPRPRASREFSRTNPDLARIYNTVAASGVPNYRGARIPLSHGLNVAEWRRCEHLLDDKSLVDMLAFGFPVGYQASEPPALGVRNHSSAVRNPLHVHKYLQVERSHQAIAGPFRAPPFRPWFRTNPVMTRPKRDSTDFRVILDMSYPPGDGVNAYIPASALDGAEFKLRLPSPLDLAYRMRQCGRGCLLFKADLSRAYRQLRSDPLDWPLLGIHWDEEDYVDVSVPFGLRHGASACQRTTEAVARVVKEESGAIVHPYIDDTAAASIPLEAQAHYNNLLEVMGRFGLDAAPHKCEPPSTQMSWVGVFFDSLTMSMAIDPAKVREAVGLCEQFLCADTVTHRGMQVFLGKIFHVTKCCTSARRFTSRLLDQLRALGPGRSAPISPLARADAAWLSAFLPTFNGVRLIKAQTADVVVQVDACLQGAGAVCAGYGYYKVAFPPSILQCQFTIASLEALNMLVACRLWAGEWHGKHVLLFSDSWSAVCAANSGAAEDPLIRAVMRELWWLGASYDFELVIRHRPGALLVTADALSRAGLSSAHRGRLETILAELPESERSVAAGLLSPPLPI